MVETPGVQLKPAFDPMTFEYHLAGTKVRLQRSASNPKQTSHQGSSRPGLPDRDWRSSDRDVFLQVQDVVVTPTSNSSLGAGGGIEVNGSPSPNGQSRSLPFLLLASPSLSCSRLSCRCQFACAACGSASAACTATEHASCSSQRTQSRTIPAHKASNPGELRCAFTARPVQPRFDPDDKEPAVVVRTDAATDNQTAIEAIANG